MPRRLPGACGFRFCTHRFVLARFLISYLRDWIYPETHLLFIIEHTRKREREREREREIQKRLDSFNYCLAAFYLFLTLNVNANLSRVSCQTCQSLRHDIVKTCNSAKVLEETTRPRAVSVSAELRATFRDCSALKSRDLIIIAKFL